MSPVTAQHNPAAAYYTAALNSSPPDRDALVEAHLPQVRLIADRLAARLPSSVDRDDLVGAGVIGLLDAVDRYDASRGVLFKTFAEMRVRGAMLDSLRDLDWAPRSLRRRAREVEEAIRRVEQRLGRHAGEEEIAAELSLGVSEYQQLLGELRGLSVTTLDADEDEETGTRFRQIADESAPDPLADSERAEAQGILAAAVGALPAKERQVVALYYLEELTMKEAGEALGVTESRVSQLHTQAVLRLRAHFGVEMRRKKSARSGGPGRRRDV
jgi:RNA polymerase sigma factor FliA